MKFFVSIILTALIALAFGLFLPWWSIAVGSFLVAVFLQLKPLYAFISGFAALFFCWGLLAWIKSSANDGVLGPKMAMLVLKTDNTFILILVTALIGAIIAGLASLSGSLLRLVIKNNN